MRPYFLVFSVFFLLTSAHAQEDSTQPAADNAPRLLEEEAITLANEEVDTTGKKKWSPAKTAAVYSAILPGAGQAYNRKYWKMPLVYGALAIPAYTFSYNLTWFKRTRYAYNYLYDKNNPGANPNPADSLLLSKVHERLIPHVLGNNISGLQSARNSFRRDLDYSALIFILLWGLNVVDAAVDGHLKDFDISEDLSIQIKSGHMPISNTTGVGIVLNIGKNHVNKSSGR